jgi:hypothetical protein
MSYAPHHPQGALMISAESEEMILDWSSRQPGTKAGLVSITERTCTDAVERSGTGMKAMDAPECQPLIGIMANFYQSVSDDDHMDCDSYLSSFNSGGRKPIWH